MKVLAILAILNTLWLFAVWLWFQTSRGLSPELITPNPPGSGKAFLPSDSKHSVNILEISSPVGVFVIARSGIPSPEAFFLFASARVSVLTKGTIVSKFLGYLYSLRVRREAEVIEFDYLLPARSWNAVFHFDFTTTGQQKTLEFGVSDSFVGMFSYPEKSGIGKLSYPWDLSCYPEWNRVKAADLSEAGAVHRDLMITASSTQPSLGILVALKQADEALRQGRNTQAGKHESIATQV
jgi:hypothetical protein